MIEQKLLKRRGWRPGFNICFTPLYEGGTAFGNSWRSLRPFRAALGMLLGRCGDILGRLLGPCWTYLAKNHEKSHELLSQLGKQNRCQNHEKSKSPKVCFRFRKKQKPKVGLKTYLTTLWVLGGRVTTVTTVTTGAPYLVGWRR